MIGVFMIAAPQVFLGYRIYMSFLATVPPQLILGARPHAGDRLGRDRSLVPLGDRVRGLPVRLGLQDLRADLARALAGARRRRAGRRGQRPPGRGDRHPLDHRDARHPVLLGRHHDGPDRRPVLRDPHDRRLHDPRCAGRPHRRGAGPGAVGDRARGGFVVRAQPSPLRRASAVHRRQRQGRPGWSASTSSARRSSCSL